MTGLAFKEGKRNKTETLCTCDRGEEDAHQQCEGGGDVSKHIRLLSGCRMCDMRRVKGAFLHHVPFAEVGAPQVLYEEDSRYELVSDIMYLLLCSSSMLN